MPGTELQAERMPYVLVYPPLRIQRFAYHTFQVLRASYTLLFVIVGADKYVELVAPWERALAVPVPISGHSFMLIVGAFEIYLGILIGIVPRIGAFAAAAWLAVVIVNLLFLPGAGDVVLRNLGLALGAVALGLLARFQRGPLLPSDL